MADKPLQEIVISPEEATFWLDRWGRWCNRHGPFEHPKIISYFNAAIARDEKGYFVAQVNGDIYEKVYFRHEDTALFVFDVLPEDDLTLVLNTGRRMALDPAALFIRNDALYFRNGPELIKFNEASMLKISRHFTITGDQCFLRFRGRSYAVPVMEADPSSGGTSGPPRPSIG